MSVDFAAKEAELKTKEEAIAARERTLAEAEKKAKKAGIVAFAETLASDGKILPRQKAGLVEFMALLDAGATVEFSEGDATVKKPAREWLEAFLQTLPKRIDFGERGAGDGGDSELGNAEATAKAALQYQAEQAKLGITVRASDAVRHVSSAR